MNNLDNVSLERIEAAIASIRELYPDKPSKDINISFEYLIGSFYPNVLKNIKESIKDAYTQGYIEGTKNLTSE